MSNIPLTGQLLKSFITGFGMAAGGLCSWYIVRNLMKPSDHENVSDTESEREHESESEQKEEIEFEETLWEFMTKILQNSFLDFKAQHYLI